MLDHPEDDQLRLVYADWMEEIGETEHADLIRCQIELASLPVPVVLHEWRIFPHSRVFPLWEEEKPPENLALEALVDLTTLPASSFPVTQAEIGTLASSLTFQGTAHVQGLRYLFPSLVLDYRGEVALPVRPDRLTRVRLLALPTLYDNKYIFYRILTEPLRHEELQQQERSLLRDETVWEWFGPYYSRGNGGELSEGCIFPTFSRGFPDSVVTDWSNWQVHGPTIVHRHPIRRVDLKHKHPFGEVHWDNRALCWRWYRVEPIHTDASEALMNACLPWQIFDLATKGRKFPKDYFATRQEALEVVSAALLEYAKAPGCDKCKGAGVVLGWDCRHCCGYGRLLPC